MTTTAAYQNFQDINGNSYSFNDYMTFAEWWFDMPQRQRVAHFDKKTLNTLQRVAQSSKAARTPKF
jgi:hypothetical protein